MPSDDLILNVRQIAGYPDAGSILSGDDILLQRGLGGPYLSSSAQNFVATALASGGDMTINGDLSVLAIMGGSAQFSNGAFGLLVAQTANFTFATVAGCPVVTTADLAAGSVTSFNTRTGAVVLTLADVTGVGGAPIASPNFSGVPTAPTAAPGSSTGQIATCAFVEAAITGGTAGVSSFNTRTGAVIFTSADLSAAGGALLASPVFTGVPAGPTAAPGTNTTQLATTAFVEAAVAAGSAGVSSFNGRIGAVTLIANDISAAGGAVLASPAFTGTPTAPTAAPGTNTTQLATCAFVTAAIAAAPYAPLASPGFTGTPTGPTAAPGTNTTQLATTAYVTAALAAFSGAGVTSFNSRTGAVNLIANDISSVGGALLASPAFTGAPSAPTALLGTNSTQLATTAFVQAAVTAATAGVSSFNTRTGAVTLTTADVTSAGGAPLASPAFTGTPSLPAGSVIAGVTNASAAPAGQVGEVVTATASAVAAGATTVAKTAVTLNLTAGDWDIWGVATTTLGTGGATTLVASLSLTTNALDATWRNQLVGPNLGASSNQFQPVLYAPLSVSAATAIYLVITITYASGSCQIGGTIVARRRR